MTTRTLSNCNNSMYTYFSKGTLIIAFTVLSFFSMGQNGNVGQTTDTGPISKGTLPYPDYRDLLYTSRSVIIYSSAQSEIEASKKAAVAFNSSKNLHADLVIDTLALRSDLRGANLYVFGSGANTWINEYRSFLPIAVRGDLIEASKTYIGNDYRVVCLAPNPVDAGRVLLFFVAQESNGVKDINLLYDKNQSNVQYSVFKADSLAEDGFIQYRGGNVVFQHRSPLADRLFSVKELHEDVASLLKELEAIHPNLYAYQPRAGFIKDVAAALKKIGRPMTRKEFGQLMIPIVNSLRHGHTNLNLPWADLDLYKREGGTFIPFNTLVDNSRLLVANSLNDKIPPNAQVLFINGLSSQEILGTLRSFLNGEKEDYKDSRIGQYFHLYAWFLFKGSGSPFKIVVLDSAGIKRIVETPGLQLSSINFSESQVQYKPPFEMNYINDSIAHLKYNLCANYDEFKVFLSEHFEKIKNRGIRNLIIDIRDNGGGNSGVNNLLFNYLTNIPYNNGEGSQWKVSYANLLRYPWLPNLIQEGRMNKDSLVLFEDQPTIPDTVQYPFAGRAFLLTSRMTFSSANMFASTFKCNRFGQVVGEETGGVTVSYGETYPVFLQHTKLMAGIATKKFVEACGVENARGVIPDILVKDSRVNGQDNILSVCLRQITGE